MKFPLRAAGSFTKEILTSSAGRTVSRLRVGEINLYFLFVGTQTSALMFQRVLKTTAEDQTKAPLPSCGEAAAPASLDGIAPSSGPAAPKSHRYD